MHDASHLGHVHLNVRDADAAVDFYEAVLGLDVAERHGRFAFLTLGEHHHDLALQGVGGGDGTDEPSHPGRPEPGLYHHAWELPDDEALAAAYDRLQERGVAVSPVDHGISRALYFEDPDGNGVELYVDTRAERGIEAWDGRNQRFDPHERVA